MTHFFRPFLGLSCIALFYGWLWHLHKTVKTHTTYHTMLNISLHHSLCVNSMFLIYIFKLTILNDHCNCAQIDVRHAPTPMLCCWWMGWIQEQISEAGQDTLFLTGDLYKGIFGLYDYDGHNASWLCHEVYFLSQSKVTQDGHNASWQCYLKNMMEKN